MITFKKDRQYYKFCSYGFLKNLRFYDAFLLLFFLENGASFSQIGILYAAREIIINSFEIPSGIIADTYGRKNSLLIALFSYILSFLVFYYSENFGLLLIAMVFNGIGDAFRSGTHKGMIMDYLKLNKWDHYKINYYGHTRSWSQKGSAISALFAGFIVLYSGSYRIIYLFSIIPYILNLVNIFTYPNILNHSTTESNKTRPKQLRSVFKIFLQVMKKKEIFKIINSTAIHSAFLKAIKDYIQPIMVQVAILIPILVSMDQKRKSGFIIGIIYFIIYILTSYASKFSIKVKNLMIKNISKSTLLFGLASGVACGVFINYKLWVIALLVFTLIYIIENVRKPILTGDLADIVPNEILTSVISAQSFYQTIITSTLAIIFGIIADNFGLGISLISVSGLIILIIILIENSKYKI